jgi:NADH-quinone oxidoreductase subunit I
MGYFKDIAVGGWSLVAGLIVTGKRLLQHAITTQYPRQKIPMAENFRGHIEQVRFEDGGTHHCVACGLCARICPSGVIKVQGKKEFAGTEKVGTFYFIDFSRCSLCGLCVDACPEKTIRFTREYELAGLSRWDSVMDLMMRLEKTA